MERTFRQPSEPPLEALVSDPDHDPGVAFPETHIGIEEAFLRGLQSKSTRQVYRSALRDFTGFLGGRDPLRATRRDVEAFRALLEEDGRSPSTICKVLSGISSFFSFALEEEFIERNPVAAVRRPKVSQVSPRLALSSVEVRAIINICDTSTSVGLRDRAMLTFLGVQGWRIAEVLALRVEDLDEEAGQKVATVHGKGAKVRPPDLVSKRHSQRIRGKTALRGPSRLMWRSGVEDRSKATGIFK